MSVSSSCIWQKGDLNNDSFAHCVHKTSPLLISLEQLICSVVRVGCRQEKDDTAEQSAFCDISLWTSEEKACYIDAASSWIKDSLPFGLGAISNSSHFGVYDDACDILLDKVRKEPFCFDKKFVEIVLRSSFWGGSICGMGCHKAQEEKRRDGCVKEIGKQVNFEFIKLVGRNLCRVLRQRHEEEIISAEAVAVKQNWLRTFGKPQEAKNMEIHDQEAIEKESSRVFAVLAKATKRRFFNNEDDLSKRPFFVGLVCREQDGHLPPGGIFVRPFSTTNLTSSFSYELFEEMVKASGGEGNENEKKDKSSVNVMLLEVEFGRTDDDQLDASLVWRTLLSVVDFVYVVGGSVVVGQLASLIDDVCCTAAVVTPELKHFGTGCGVRQAVRPFFFYTVVGEESSACVEQFSGRARSVNNLPSLLALLLCAKELQLSSCCQGLLQWLLLFGHTWRFVGDACDKTSFSSSLSLFLSLSLKERISIGVHTAVDMFVFTSEALLLTMRSMEPLPPLLVRGCNVGRVTAVTRQFSLEDVLDTARCVAFLAYEMDVLPCLFEKHLIPRNSLLVGEYCGCRHYAAREELNAACQLEWEALKERLLIFSTDCAVQALTSRTAVQERLLCDANGKRCTLGEVSFVNIIKTYANKIEEFLTSPIISHCAEDDEDDVDDGSEENAENSTRRSMASKTATFAATAANWRLGRRCRQNLRCRMVESPIIFPFVQRAKAAAISEYLQRFFIPAMLDIAQRYESTFTAKESELAELRETLFLVEDRCVQFQRREKKMEAEVKERQCALREAKQHSSTLAAQLSESCKCLQKLITTCVGYKEAHSSFTQKLAVSIKRNFAMEGVAPFFDFSTTNNSLSGRNKMTWNHLCETTPQTNFFRTPEDRKAGDTASLLVVDEYKKKGAVGGNKEASLSPLVTISPLEQAEFLRLMLRDVHQQLDACYNVVLCIFEAACGTFSKLCTTNSELFSVNCNGFARSLHSPTSQTAEGTISVERCINLFDESCCDAADENAATQISSTTKRNFFVGNGTVANSETAAKHDANVNNGDEVVTTNITVGSKLSKCMEYPNCGAPQDSSNQKSYFTELLQTQRSSKEQQEYIDGVSDRNLQSSLFCHTAAAAAAAAATAASLPTPDKAKTVAVDALADLQRQRQVVMEALANTKKRCELLEGQLEEERAALRDAQLGHALREQQWKDEREALLSRINAAVGEAQLAREKELESQQEAERLTKSLLDMLASLDAEVQRVLENSSGTHRFGDRYTEKVNGNSEKEDDRHEIGECYAVEPHETIRAVKLQLFSLLADVDAIMGDHRREAKEHAAALQVALNCARQEAEEQRRASTEAALCASMESARMLTEVENLKKSLMTAEEREKRVQFERDQLELRVGGLWRLLSHVEAAQARLFSMWGEMAIERWDFILQHWWEMARDFCAERQNLCDKLKQSQAEAERWEESVHHHFDALQKAAGNVTELTRMLAQHKVEQTAAEKEVCTLRRRLSGLSTAYFESFAAWESLVAQRCELLLQQWVCLPPPPPPPPPPTPPPTPPPPRRDEFLSSNKSSQLDVVEDTRAFSGLCHELRQKKRRIADLEEALRQKKIACESLTEAVEQLHAILNMQRELGMAQPPPLPLLSPEFGVLPALSATNAKESPLASSFFVSPSRLGMEGSTMKDECRGVGFTVGLDAVAPAKSSDTASEKSFAVEPRPLKWYLRSLSAIESTLTR